MRSEAEIERQLEIAEAKFRKGPCVDMLLNGVLIGAIEVLTWLLEKTEEKPFEEPR